MPRCGGLKRRTVISIEALMGRCRLGTVSDQEANDLHMTCYVALREQRLEIERLTAEIKKLRNIEIHEDGSCVTLTVKDSNTIVNVKY